MLEIALSDEKSCCFSDVWMFRCASFRAVMNIHVDTLNIYLGLSPTYSNNLNRSKSKASASTQAMLARDQATNRSVCCHNGSWTPSMHCNSRSVCVWIR